MLATDLIKQLASTHQLVGLGRHRALHLGIPFHGVDLVQADAIRDLVLSLEPQVILHTAAMTDVDRCETNPSEALQGNFEATRNAVDAANRVSALFIFFSTDFIFDGKKIEPYVENDPPHPLSVYGASKWLAERYVALRAKRYLILRTSWLFGKQRETFPSKVLKQAEAGTPFPVVTDEVGNPTFTSDLAGIVSNILAAFQKQPNDVNQIYHAANEGVVSRFEWARTILRKKNLREDLVYPIKSEEIRSKRPAQRPQNSALSLAKVKSRFGLSIRHWEDALSEFMKEGEVHETSPR